MKVTGQNPPSLPVDPPDPRATDPPAENPKQFFLERLTSLNDLISSTQREVEKAHILRIAAHDLRNPISGILFATEYLLECLPDVRNEEQVEVLRTIHASGEFLLHLIDEIVEISAIESGMVNFQVEPTDLVALVKKDLLLNRKAARRKGIDLNLIVDEPVPLVFIDPKQISQVIDNLVTSAIRLSYRDCKINIRVSAKDGSAILSVLDPRMDVAENLKTELKVGSNVADLGVGLAMVTRIVEGHGGQVRMDREAGKGSTFTVSLPISVNANSRPASRGGARSQSNPVADHISHR